MFGRVVAVGILAPFLLAADCKRGDPYEGRPLMSFSCECDPSYGSGGYRAPTRQEAEDDAYDKCVEISFDKGCSCSCTLNYRDAGVVDAKVIDAGVDDAVDATPVDAMLDAP